MGFYIVSRLFLRAAPTLEEKTDFDYASTAQVGSVLTPEPLDIEDPQVISPEEFPAYDIDPEADETLIQEETFTTAEEAEEPVGDAEPAGEDTPVPGEPPASGDKRDGEAASGGEAGREEAAGTAPEKRGE